MNREYVSRENTESQLTINPHKNKKEIYVDFTKMDISKIKWEKPKPNYDKPKRIK